MSSYRYLFADLRTNDILAELPLTNVTFSQVLNGAGSLTGEILGSDVNEAPYDFTNTTIPARTALYVERDNVLIWGGVIWTRTWNSDTQHYTFTAREFPSYFERRRITETTVFTNEDQLVIAQTLIDDAQNVTGGDIGVIVNTETSPILVDRVYFDYEFKDVWGAIKDLSNQQDGFDFNIDVAYDSGGNPLKYLRLDYPARGRTFLYNDPAALVFDFPGNLVMYEYPEDGAITTNKMYGIGPNSNEAMIRAVATSPSNQIANGWPLLEDTTTYNDQYDPNLLYQQTLGEVTAKENPVTTIKIVIPAYVNPVLGSYKTGDQCLLRITDDRFPGVNGEFGLVTIQRIVAIAVEPGEDGPERVTLTLADLT